MSLETTYSNSLGNTLDKADPYIQIQFNGANCQSKIIKNNDKPVFNERFTFLMKEEQLLSCGIIQDKEVNIESKDKNSTDNYITITLMEKEYIRDDELKGRRISHINFFLK